MINPIDKMYGIVPNKSRQKPCSRRGTGALPPAHLDMDEQVKPIQQHGFTIVDFSPDKIVLRMFKWDVKTQSVDAIDTLEPFHTAELTRAG
jgi:hypothetical protein